MEPNKPWEPLEPQFGVPFETCHLATTFAQSDALETAGVVTETVREPSVVRGVSHGGYAHARIREEMRTKSAAELHESIVESRKMMMHHRMEKFRKKRPSAGSKYEWQYRIALAKTFLKQQELADKKQEPLKIAGEKALDFPERPTLSQWMIENEDLDLARTEWYAVGGHSSRPINQKIPFPRRVRFEKRFYKKQNGTQYISRNTTGVKIEVDKGIHWEVSATRLDEVGFDPECVDIKNARKAKTKNPRKAKMIAKRNDVKDSKTQAKAFASQEPSASGVSSAFAGVALLGLGAMGAARGRRRYR
ncbi:unnamed protein product [Effrenium voratum]|nr:unnamed protein product [Effrenium voratum]